MVKIFDDRVESHKPGGLPKGLSPEEFGKRSGCRNSLITGLLLRCDYIAKVGTGIERIHGALEREKCPAVNICFNTMFTLEFPRPTYVKAKDKTKKTSEKILRIIARNQRTTISELAEAIGVTTRSIERNIKNLQAQGRLRRSGPDKDGHWEVIG